ncbi:MAG: phosphoribosylglycinamide formyltransferase, partial [Gammaproteobacteria bacterium]
PVADEDDSASLAARVLTQEHRIYPQVVRWFAQGRLMLGDDDLPRLDGQPLFQPLRLDHLTSQHLT